MLNTEMIRIIWLCEIFISERYLLINSGTSLDIPTYHPRMEKNCYLHELFNNIQWFYLLWFFVKDLFKLHKKYKLKINVLYLNYQI